METDDLVYKKYGKKYIPFGMCYAPEYLTPGLWYCHIDEHSRGYTNADKCIGTLLKVSDVEYPIVKQCEAHKVAEKVLEIINKEYKNKSYSFQELIDQTVMETIKICNEHAVQSK